MGLRDTAERISRMGRLPAPPADRKLAIEKAAESLAAIGDSGRREPESWDDFLRRIGVISD